MAWKTRLGAVFTAEQVQFAINRIMHLITPIIILLTAFVLIQIMHWIKLGLHWDWIISIFGLAGVWLFLIAIPIDRYAPVIINLWVPDTRIESALVLKMTDQNWMVLVILTAYFTTHIIISVISERDEKEPFSWHFSLLLLAAVFVAILAADLILIIFCLTLFDLAQFSLELAARKQIAEHSGHEIKALSYKLISSFMLIGISIVSTAAVNEPLSLAFPQKKLGLLFLALIFRLLSNRLQRQDETLTGNLYFIWSLMQPAIFIIFMATLSKLSITDLSISLKSLLSIGLVIVLLLISIRNLRNHEISGLINNWGMIYVCGVMIGVIQGMSWASYYWIPSYIVIQASIFLPREVEKKWSWYPYLLMGCAIAIPFNPFSPMWSVVLPAGWIIIAVFIFAIGISVFSLIRFFVKKKSIMLRSANGILFVYIFVMMVFVLGIWMILGKTNQVPISQRQWWIGTISLGIGLFFLLMERVLSKKRYYVQTKLTNMNKQVKVKIEESRLIKSARLLPGKIFNFLQSSFDFISNVLEGESGLLWSILILMLFISLLGNGVIL